MSASKLKPYPSYTDSKFEFISQFPSHWELKRMQWIGKFSASGIDKLSVDTESDCLMVNYTDVYGNETAEIHSNQELMKTTATNQKIAEHHLEKGDMLFTPSSETIDDIGVSVVAVEDMPEIVYSYHLTRFRPTIPLDVNFSRFFCNSTPVLSQLSAIARGTTRQILSRMDFNTLNVAIPSEKERVVIGRFLSLKTKRITATIQHLENNVSLLEEKRSSLITQVVTKGLNPDAAMKDSGIEWIGKVPEHWGIIPLKFDFDIQLGKMLQNDLKKDTDTHEYYLKSANIQWNGVSLKPKSKMWFSKAEKEKYHLIKGDLLISEGGDVGRSCLYENEYGDCYIQNAVHRVRSTSYISTDYLYYFMRSMHHSGFIEIICNKSTIPHFTVEKVSRVRFTRPPSDEISEIVKQLNVKCKQIQDSMNLIEDTIKKLKEYRTALISAAVTGKIDVRGQA
tara:strand:- start:2 stop:1354 length:1353 start_codon:yes stop_codon:yes gene_type:complete